MRRVLTWSCLIALVAWVVWFCWQLAGAILQLEALRADAASVSVVEQTLARLKAEEGFSAKPYRDIEGVWTIGFGTAIGKGITRREGEYLLRDRLAATHEALTKELPWLSDAPAGQQSAILDMGYQLGAHGVLEFHDMLAALEADKLPSGQSSRARFGVGAGDAGAG